MSVLFPPLHQRRCCSDGEGLLIQCDVPRQALISDDTIQHARRHHEATRCTCGEYIKTGETLKHWTESKSHPTCPACGDGFENHIILEQVYHCLHRPLLSLGLLIPLQSTIYPATIRYFVSGAALSFHLRKI